jgi:Alpha/beta hydrolase domain
MTGISRVSDPAVTTAERRPFGTGWARPGETGPDLEAAGYTEEELIVSGTADIYDYDDQFRLRTRDREVPYTTRVLVRKPADPSRSSGVVQLEPLHPSMDRDLTWRAIHPWIIRNGHAWVGVTQAPVMARTLSQTVDSERYGQLSIRDSGLAWEIVSQVASALRAGALGITGVNSMYMSGWSMTGTFCRVFLGDGFHARTLTADDGPAIDGYVIGISSGSFMAGGYQPVSDGSGFLPASDPRRVIGAHAVPVIELLSEFESETHTGALRPDSDGPGDPYRLYQVAGACHASSRQRGRWPGDVQARTLGLGDRPDLVEQPSTFPLEYVATAVFEHLHRWAADGVLPPRAPRLRFGDASEGEIRGKSPEARPLARDVHGNAAGGVRSTYVDVPVATYIPHSTLRDGPAPTREGGPVIDGDLSGHMRPFSQEKLRSLYDSEALYREAVSARAAELLKEGWLLDPEAAEVISEASEIRFDT